MAGGTFSIKTAIAGVAIAIIAAVALVAWGLYAAEGGEGTAQEAQIVIAGPIDAIDSEASFHPPAIRVLLDSNNTVTWTNRNGTSVSLQSSEGLFDVVIPPGESFSFTFDRPGIYEYFAKESGKTATILVSTAEIEASRLAPVSLSKLHGEDAYRDIAAAIAAAADPQDRVKEVRLNNTRMATYVTESGADIRVPKSMCDSCVQSERYDAIVYRSGGSNLLGPDAMTVDAAVDFSRQFMERIGYELDGTEWVDAVDFGSRIEVAFSQKADKWIIPSHIVRFNYYHDHASIDISKWYNDISEYEFGLSQYDAVPIAKEFMDSEVASTHELQKYGYADGSPTLDAWVEIFDDKVVYVVGVGYSATNPEYMDDRDHCGSPAGKGFDVLVDASSGRALGWRYSLCM